MKTLYLDLESDGLNPNISHLIQFGYILEESQLVGKMGKNNISFSCKVDKKITEDEFVIKKNIVVSETTTKLTGLTQSDIDSGMDPNIVFGRIASLIENSDVLVGHNIIKFDLPFIITRLNVWEMVVNPHPDQIIIDTAALFKAVKGGYVPMPNETLAQFQRRVLNYKIYGLKFNLDLAMQHFKIEIKEGEDRHTALADIRYTKLVYKQLRNLPQFAQFNLP